ncbi:sorbosone dehydrogenase family protein [Sphingomonas psychrotolerans]|uniref:Sorbosone dehydrogenase family protein n=1 Tax=Sphingomonas psychrotolerans TaxID=1327635 RepID=A0ABU3N5K6_9SPHN|nr:sorbosone dehydrogenase family protein [Sphingomonas psychrotolerans]MDT8759129.1 sorbosone dehydrogenase family protein [Sphingomonas psychrotolerans]
MLKRILIVLAILIALAIGGWFWISQPDKARLSEQAVTGRVPQLTETRSQTVPTVGIAKPVGWAGGAKPTSAAGLQVAAFADRLEHPRWLYRLPNGDILVAETNSPPREGGGITGWVMNKLLGQAGAAVPSPNRITLLRDTNGDGVADQRSALLTGLNSPTGMALVGNWLYVANTDALVRYPFTPGQTKITAKPEKIIGLPGGGNHWARNVVAAPDGKTLYVSVGSSSNIAENGLDAEGPTYTAQGAAEMARASNKPGRAMILQVWPDTRFTRVYAWGLRNPNGMAFEPKSGALWTVVNERDMLGSDMPPDYLTQVDLGAFYGWPWNYWGGYVDRRVEPERPDLREYTRRPDFALGAHVAPLGLSFASDARLGGNWTNGAFVGLHGSWNREPKSGYKVVYVPFADNGFPVKDAKPVDLLTGFLSPDGKTTRGRPVGVITDASGALLVADDVGNVIWRVSPGTAK